MVYYQQPFKDLLQITRNFKLPNKVQIFATMEGSNRNKTTKSSKALETKKGG